MSIAGTYGHTAVSQACDLSDALHHAQRMENMTLALYCGGRPSALEKLEERIQLRRSVILEIVPVQKNDNVTLRNFLHRRARRGDYLVKRVDKECCLTGIGYVSFATTSYMDNWTVWSRRDGAEWFTREEAAAVAHKLRGENVKVVRRKKGASSQR